MLCHLNLVKSLLGLAATDPSQDSTLLNHLGAADQAVKNYCKRDFELTVYTAYVDGRNQPRLVLRQRPVRSYALSGTTTSASTSVTGISDTGNLTVGMPVLGTGIPHGTTLSAITSPSAITLSAAATASGTVTLKFGLAVWLHAGGFAGQSADPFPESTQLEQGVDFYLEVDQPDGSSKCGLLRRLGGGPTGSAIDWPWEWRKGSLTARMAPAWPDTAGGIKVMFTAGFAEGQIPADLQMATAELTCWLFRFAGQGGYPVSSEGYEGYNYALGRLATEPELGSIRQLLSRHREV